MRFLRAIPIFLIALIPAFAADTKKTIVPGDIVDLKNVQDVQISPDGKRVVFVVGAGNIFGELRDKHIWISPIDGSEPPRLFAFSEKSEDYPRWSPDGQYVAFLSKRRMPDSKEIPE